MGFIFLLIPIFYLEVGRPNDLIKAGLNLLIGIILIIKNKVFENSFFVISYLLVTSLFIFYLSELFSYRWNQLTDKEKGELITSFKFKKNLSEILEAIKLGFLNLSKSLNSLNFNKNKEDSNKKKWVRNNRDDNIEP
ncbi:hypothetical protein OAX47_00725 [Prochlorococcus sp. AH-736-K09]|nr:hypothetical protein [Prochlorococcus sp. AH-736-K09]